LGRAKVGTNDLKKEKNSVLEARKKRLFPIFPSIFAVFFRPSSMKKK